MIDLIHHIPSMLAAMNGTDATCGAVICTTNTGIPGGTADLGMGIGKIMRAVFALMGAAAVIVVIVGGIKYVISAGDPKRVSEAKETILYAVIGVVISLSAYAIVTAIANGLG